MSTLQAFKETDLVELKVRNVLLPFLELLGAERDTLYDQAYSAYPLGGALWDLGASPVVSAVPRATFLESFEAIHLLFTRPGTFEFYMAVFRAVWGPDVVVVFTNTLPGQLSISIQALAVQLDLFYARKIVGNAYVYDEVIDESVNNLVFQIAKGLRTQSEADALLNELAPAGIYVTTTLTIV